jgi:hypothetical protein
MVPTPRRTRLVRALEQLLDVPPLLSFTPPPAPPVPNYEALESSPRGRLREELQRLRVEHEHARTGGHANIDADHQPLRIISDGRGANTKVYLGDHDLTGSILALTWQLDGDGVVRCLLETEGVHLEHGPASE